MTWTSILLRSMSIVTLTSMLVDFIVQSVVVLLVIVGPIVKSADEVASCGERRVRAARSSTSAAEVSTTLGLLEERKIIALNLPSMNLSELSGYVSGLIMCWRNRFCRPYFAVINHVVTYLLLSRDMVRWLVVVPFSCIDLGSW